MLQLQEFLKLPRPTCIIIDDFARLDRFTQAVLQAALQSAQFSSQGVILWIVLEQNETGPFTRKLRLQPGARGDLAGGNVDIFGVEPLTIEENEVVLESHGLPTDRARDGLFVKALLHDGYFFGVFRSYWDGLRMYRLPQVWNDREWCDTLMTLLESGGLQPALAHALDRMRTDPPPFIARPQNVPSVVMDFVLIGQVLFRPDAPAREVEFARQVLNRATGNELRTFLDIILMSETVPPVLRDLIRDHRRDLTAELARRRPAA